MLENEYKFEAKHQRGKFDKVFFRFAFQLFKVSTVEGRILPTEKKISWIP